MYDFLPQARLLHAKRIVELPSVGQRVQVLAPILFVLLFARPLASECIPFDEALKHIGENRCVTGKIIHVQSGTKGTHYLDFCEDYRSCTFTAVIFHGDLKQVGDIRRLEGRTVELHGDIRLYDQRAEIIVQDASQLGGDAGRIPPLPKDFDVERKGRYSAGTFSHAHSSSTSPAKKRQPAHLPTIVPTDEDPD